MYKNIARLVYALWWWCCSQPFILFFWFLFWLRFRWLSNLDTNHPLVTTTFLLLFFFGSLKPAYKISELPPAGKHNETLLIIFHSERWRKRLFWVFFVFSHLCRLPIDKLREAQQSRITIPRTVFHCRSFRLCLEGNTVLLGIRLSIW